MSPAGVRRPGSSGPDDDDRAARAEHGGMWRRRARVTAPEAPDCLEPVVAWRFWYARGRDWPILSSVNFDVPWPHGRPLEAACLTERPRGLRGLWLSSSVHTPPASLCGCGIYAAPLDRLRSCLPGWQVLDANRLVVGRVALWGVVHEHQRGWRASLAYPQHLFVPRFAEDGSPEEIAASLADYAVPVELLEASTTSTGLTEIAARLS
jgi:hypothetical protein